MTRATIIYFFVFLSFIVTAPFADGMQCHPDSPNFCLELLDENGKALKTEPLETYTHKATIEFPKIPFGKAIRRTITLSNVSTKSIEGFGTGFNGTRNVLWSFQGLKIGNFFRSPNECSWFPFFFSGLKVTKESLPQIEMIYAPLPGDSAVTGNHAIEFAPFNQGSYITIMRTLLNFKTNNEIEPRYLEKLFGVSYTEKSENSPATIRISISQSDFDRLSNDDQIKDDEYLFVYMEKEQLSDNQVVILFDDEDTSAVKNAYVDTLGDTEGHSHKAFGNNNKNYALRMRDTNYQDDVRYWFFFKEPGTITLKCYPLDDSSIASESKANLILAYADNKEEIEVTAKSPSPFKPHTPTNISPENKEASIPINTSLTWQDSGEISNDVTYYVYMGEEEDRLSHKGTIQKSQIAYTIPKDLAFTPKNLKSDTTYYWKIVSEINFNGKTYRYNGLVYSFTTKSAGLFGSPSPSDGDINVSANLSVLSWDGGVIDSNIKYNISLTDISLPDSSPIKIEGLTSSNQAIFCSISGQLKPYTEYLWQVEQISSNGKRTLGPIWKFKTGGNSNTANNPPNKPTPLSPSDRAEGIPVNLTLKWSGGDPDTNDPVTYIISWGRFLDSTIEKTETVSANTYQLQDLEYNTTYWWKIISRDSKGLTAIGAPWTFKTKDSGTATSTTTTTTVRPTTTTLVTTTTTTTSTTTATTTTTTILDKTRPNSPFPLNGAKDVPIENITLSWTPVYSDSYYNIYLGKDINLSIPRAKDETKPSYKLTEVLDYDTTYYWKILESTNQTSKIESPVWSFTTIGKGVIISGVATDFGEKGLWFYDGNKNTWTGLTGWNPENIVAWKNKLAADFGEKGLYLYGGAKWQGVAGWNPDSITAWGDKLAADFGEKGLYLYDGSAWKGITGWNPDSMTAWGDKLAADFGAKGLYIYNGTAWTGITGWNPENIVAWGNRLAVDFDKEGLWLYDGTAWTGLTVWNPENIIAWGDKLAADFGAANGLYLYDGTEWKEHRDWNPENMIAWESNLAASLGANGLYLYDGTKWQDIIAGITGWNPENMTAWGSKLVVDFGSDGLWLYYGNSWTGLSGWNPEDMKAVEFK